MDTVITTSIFDKYSIVYNIRWVDKHCELYYLYITLKVWNKFCFKHTKYLLCVWKKCIDIKCHLHNCTDLKNDFSNHIIFQIFRASEIEEKFYEIIWKRKYLSKHYFISNKTNEAITRFGILKWWHLFRPRSYFICK